MVCRVRGRELEGKLVRARTTGASAGTRDPPAIAGDEPGSGGGGEAEAGKDEAVE